ncbi:MAG: M28 family peptidase [bacterium]|nr:M28 family peptidase [bacterium]
MARRACLAATAAILVAVGGRSVTARTEGGVPVFSGARAFVLLEEQCALGARTPGSAGNRALRERIMASASAAGLRAVPVCFEAPLGPGGTALEACNIVVSAGPSGGPRLWLGAHFDTRPWADRDPVASRRSLPIVGANDGASGTAVLLHLIELLGQVPPPQGVDLLFFDAEDSGEAHDAAGFCLGSRHLVATRGEFGNPLAGLTPRGMILLDMVGEAGARIPQEGYSLAQAPEWTNLVFERAATLGLAVFEAVPGPAVYDDHVPFLLAGIPAVNLIDFDYPHWHTHEDTPERCSPATLAQVGRLVTDLVYRR